MVRQNLWSRTWTRTKGSLKKWVWAKRSSKSVVPNKGSLKNKFNQEKVVKISGPRQKSHWKSEFQQARSSKSVILDKWILQKVGLIKKSLPKCKKNKIKQKRSSKYLVPNKGFLKSEFDPERSSKSLISEKGSLKVSWSKKCLQSLWSCAKGSFKSVFDQRNRPNLQNVSLSKKRSSKSSVRAFEQKNKESELEQKKIIKISSPG